MSNLTAPWDAPADTSDQVSDGPDRFVQMTPSEAKVAIATNSDTSALAFPMVDRYIADPQYRDQNFCLISFVPTKGALPDKYGAYGFVKVRGTFSTPELAAERSAEIIRTIDSYNPIYTAHVGRPFPVCKNFKHFVQETDEIDIQKQATEAISQNVKEKMQRERKIADEVKQAERKLLDDTGETMTVEPIDKYVEIHVKKANLIHTYIETCEKLKKMEKSIKVCRGVIDQMDIENPLFREELLGRYNNAREAVGLPTKVPETGEKSFITYLAKRIHMPFDEGEYECGVPVPVVEAEAVSDV